MAVVSLANFMILNKNVEKRTYHLFKKYLMSTYSARQCGRHLGDSAQPDSPEA